MERGLYMNKVYILLALCLLMVACRRDKATVSSSVTTSIRFVEEDHDLGRLQSDTVVYDFRFTNTGNQPLVVNKLETSCQCITAEKPSKPVMPQKQGLIRVRYVREKGQSGRFFRSVIVYSNATSQPITLSLSGEN